MTSINLNVTPSQAGAMLEFFSSQRTELINNNREIFSKLNDIDSMIDKLKGISNMSTPQYPAGKSWNQRIKYVLGMHPDGLTAREIVDAIAQIEGIPLVGDQWKEVYKGVAPSLSTGGKMYSKRENKNGNNVYTLVK